MGRLLILQRKSKQGRTKHSTGQRVDIAGPAATSSNHLHSSEFLHDFFTSVNVNSTSLRCYWSECNEG